MQKKRRRDVSRTVPLVVGSVLLAGAVTLGALSPWTGPAFSAFLRQSSLGQVILSVTVVSTSQGGGSNDTSSNTSSSGGGGGGAVGAASPAATPAVPEQPAALGLAQGDINGDGKVTLADFSILAYWYKRTLTAEAKAQVDINGDGKVTLADFSILAYYWNRV